MLRFLSIKRLAVIDSVEVEFDPGLNVLTGETGAGKSILVGAVGLLLGGRASGDLVRTGEESALVEALFERNGKELAIRRELTAQGRSRAFVNGALTTAAALKELSSSLVELHGQHEHQTLLDPSSHLSLLDTYSAHDELLSSVAEAYQAFTRTLNEYENQRKAEADRANRQDLVAFQLAELDRAAIRVGEDEELMVTRQVLAHAERIERLCAEGYAALYEQDGAVLATLGSVWRKVAELSEIDPRFATYLTARDEVKAQLEDLAFFLRRYATENTASPGRLQEVEERLALLERLKRKYGPGLQEVVHRQETLRREAAALEGFDQRLAELQERYGAARQTYLAAAAALSAARREAADRFVRQLERLLNDLAMERSRFEIRFAPPLGEGYWTAGGLDRAELFVSPNAGEELRPLARIASGGELSRIMMAIKTLTSTSRHGFSEAFQRQPSSSAPGLIFDEVDAGIGGRVADVVGKKLRALGSAFQVLCITHLPQIAAHADTHFSISKRVEEGRTKTSVARLDDAGRVQEISRMLGGEAITAAIETSAREMIAGRRAARPPVADESGAKDEQTSKGESESRRSARRATRARQ